MNTTELNSRFGTIDDAETIFEVMAKAFRIDEDSSRWQAWHNLAVNDAARFRILEVDGRIVGIAHIAQRLIWIGECEITHGDVGEVSVLPEFQGNGYGIALMKDVVQWMRDNGYDISRLGGYSVFYSRFGYVPFPRRYVEFPIEPVQAGATDISVEEMFRPPVGLPGTIRPYDPRRDAIRRDELYCMFNKGRNGSVVRHLDPDAKLPTGWFPTDPLRLVYEANGVVEGYLFAVDEGRTIREASFNPSVPESFVGLIKHILHVAAENRVECVTSRLPFDAGILSMLTRSNIAFNLRERQGGYASNMIQILNLESLLRKITPDLESRIQASAFGDLSCEIEIGFDDQRVGIRFEGGNIAIGVPVSEHAACVRTDQATLMKLILGILSFEEAPIRNRERVAASAISTLNICFPRQNTASGTWG